MDTPEISIIVPAFNEEETIADCLRALAAVFPSGAEVLVVDGGKDRAAEVVAATAREISFVRYIRNENDRGKGHAIRTGIAHASGRFQAQFDADLQFSPSDLPRLLQPLYDDEADVVLGSRFRSESGRDAEAALSRTLGNQLVSGYMSLLFGQRLTDVLAGIKVWTRSAAEAFDLQMDGFSYELEIPAKAIRRGLRVREVPVKTRARRAGESKVNVLVEGLRFLRDATRFRFASAKR